MGFIPLEMEYLAPASAGAVFRRNPGKEPKLPVNIGNEVEMMNLEPVVLKKDNQTGDELKQSEPGQERILSNRLTYLNLTAVDLNEAEDPLDNLLWNVMFDCFPRQIKRSGNGGFPGF